MSTDPAPVERPPAVRVIGGRYRIDELVGRGGMSSVYRAFDTSLGRTVAIKLFRSELAAPDDLRRQREEVRMLATLNHPTLVTLFDAASTEDGEAFLVLEYVEGDDLGVIIGRSGSDGIDDRRVAAIGADVADAMAWIHQRGIVHRDIKPANVLVPSPGGGGVSAKLADFGIAKLIDATRMTSAGTVVGTAGYLSPEQATGSAAGPATDVYSLGLVLLECLTGQRAFPGSSVESVVARLSRDPVIPAELDRHWVRLLSLMTRRSPDERPGASEVSVRLRSIAAGSVGEETARLETCDATAALPDPSGLARLVAVDEDRTAPLISATDDATKRLPESTDAATKRLPERTDAATERLAESTDASTERVAAGGPERLRRRAGARLAVVAAIVAVGLIAAAVVWSTQRETQAAPTGVDYPAVEGELGDHLEQLQRSVEP